MVLLYPGVVYGPGDLTDGNLVVKMVADHLRGALPRHRRARATGCGRTPSWTTWPPGHVAALERGRAGERYFLAGENVDHERLLRVAGRGVGRAAAAPPHPLRGGGRARAGRCTLWAELTGQPPQLTHEVVGVFREHWAYSSAKARARARLPADARCAKGLRRTRGVAARPRRPDADAA